ncbi:MAG: molybdenum cofactor guanylyltransferase [Phycisphaerales bacterium]|nr:molybdenum cofactor guanylyltransferase [Phycisphaerales bacterium]
MTSPAPWPHTIVILAGGASRRMGEPKHALQLADGRTLADLAASLARATARRVVVSGPTSVLPDLEHIADRTPDGGPLAGIEAVMASGGDDQYLFLPCDMPGLTPELLTRLAAGLQEADATVFQRPGPGPRPVLPLGLRDTPSVHDALGPGAVHQLVERLDPVLVPVTAEEDCFLLNINTPAEWDDFYRSLR